MKNLYDELNGLYKVQKTLKFELIPQGETLTNIEKANILKDDEHRSEVYKRVKKYCDEYHKNFIEKVLNKIHLENLDTYYELYNINNRDEKEKEDFKKIKSDLRKQIVNGLNKDEEYKKLFKKEMITECLPEFYKKDSEKMADINEFQKFTTYFKGYNTNRENIYSDEEKSTAIAYRAIDENLPVFLSNIKIFEKVYAKIPQLMDKVFNTLYDYVKMENVKEIFDIDYYSFLISQSGISSYNTLISGKANSDGSKEKGFNEYINEYNQKNKEKLPKFRELYKQILSDKIYTSFKIENISNDLEIIKSIDDYYNNIEPLLPKIAEKILNISSYDLNYIFVNNDTTLTKLSNDIFGEWNYIKRCIANNYDESHEKKNTLKYEKEKSDFLNKQDCFSIAFINECCITQKIDEYIKDFFNDSNLIEKIHEKYNTFKEIEIDYNNPQYLRSSELSISTIKDLLDTIKSLQEFLKIIIPKDNTLEKDETYYSELLSYYDDVNKIIKLYNMVRNYLTQKPYSLEKFKLNFNCPTFLDGWDLNKEKDNLGVIFKRDNNYYLGVIDSAHKKIFDNINVDNSTDNYTKMEYKLLPGPNKMLPKVFFAESNKSKFNPSEELIKKYKLGYHKKGNDFNLDFCHELIDFYKKSISIHSDWKNFKFSFKDTKDYNDISEFYKDVEENGYYIEYKNYSKEYIDKLVKEGALYLFQIYSKDFSTYSKGKPNLHTMYWKALFSNENAQKGIYKLNGSAEVFYRKKSIDKSNTPIHPANQPIKNKCDDTIENGKETSVFEYDLIKNKRFTLDKFQFHVPITMNYKVTKNSNVNEIVNNCLKENDDVHVIGIDRGERNLLYISVVDKNGKIVYQRSLNEIVNEYNNSTHKVDYHKLLDKKEIDRKKAREDWKNIENIKELKEGYLSQVINEIVKLTIKYNAIIVIEDLNKGFKNSRIKFEKQVYQKFEKKLIDKLNYLVLKDNNESEKGGLYCAYQLTNQLASFKMLGTQSGILFYIPAWCTSKIDPTTGFIDRFHIKYENFEKSIEFVKNLDDIRYNPSEGYFEFDINYEKYTTKLLETKNVWTLCSYGERIYTYKNSAGKLASMRITLTDKIKELFEKYAIDYANIKESILKNADIEFFKGNADMLGFILLFKLMVQMRNSLEGSMEDNLISPVKNKSGRFFNTADNLEGLPIDADANGAYNIARKGLMLIDQIKQAPSGTKPTYCISQAAWLKYVQGEEK